MSTEYQRRRVDRNLFLMGFIGSAMFHVSKERQKPGNLPTTCRLFPKIKKKTNGKFLKRIKNTCSILFCPLVMQWFSRFSSYELVMSRIFSLTGIFVLSYPSDY